MFRIGSEPIPGYRLEEFLGRGNFGEVWRSTAPGRTSAALKFIDLGGAQGLKEFRGIQRVKEIRHAHLMPITAIWLLDDDEMVLSDEALGQYDSASGKNAKAGGTLLPGERRPRWLVVAMLLGGQNLDDVLQQYKARGEAGIPVKKLLRYMEEAAKGIDYLNSPEHGLATEQSAVNHGDIKPGNLMLVGDSVLVCDFGLARLLGDAAVRMTSTGMVGTPAFMPPECIDNPRPSTASDQYSLAISYCELRTGELPFKASTYMAVLDAHRQGNLDLSLLPPGEAEVIRRATAINPAQRFECAVEMVEALRQAVRAEHPELLSAGDSQAAQFRDTVPAAVGATITTPRQTKRWLGAAVVLVAAVSLFFVIRAVWTGPPPSPSTVATILKQYTLTVTPATATLTINGQVQKLDELGHALIAIASGESLDVLVAPPSDCYEQLSKSYSIEELEQAGFQIALAPRIMDLTVSVVPPGAIVQFRALQRSIGGEDAVAIPFPCNQAIDLVVTHPSGEYLSFDSRLLNPAEPFSIQRLRESNPWKHVELAGNNLRIELQPNALYHARLAERQVAEGNWEQAVEAYAKAIELDRAYAEPKPVFPPLHQHTDAIQFLKFSSQRLLTGSDDHTVCQWNLNADTAPQPIVLQRHTGLIECMAIDDSGRWLVTGSSDNTAILWDLSQKNPAQTATVLAGHNEDCLAVAISPDVRWIVTGGADADVCLWSIREGQAAAEPLRLTGHEDQVITTAISRDGKWLVTMSIDGKVIRWDLTAVDPSRTAVVLAEPGDDVDHGAFVDERWFAFPRVGDNRDVVLLDVTQSQPPRLLMPGPLAAMHDLQSSPDRRWLATGSDGNAALLWDLSVAKLSPLAVELPHANVVPAVAFSPDSGWLVTGSWDKTAALWELGSLGPQGNPLLLNAGDPVHSVAISPDGRWIVAGTSDGTVMVWDLTRCILIKKARDKRGFIPGESPFMEASTSADPDNGVSRSRFILRGDPAFFALTVGGQWGATGMPVLFQPSLAVGRERNNSAR